MEESDIKFSVMVSLFNWMQKSKSSAKKRSKFRKFLDAFCRKPGDYFSAVRLILPALDRERGSYGLKEHALATCLIDALGMSRDSPDAQRLLNWRKGGPKTGASAGNFSLIASEVLQRRQGLTSGELTLKKVNELLDRLALSENRVEKTSVLSDLIKETNSHEMKWIVMIILKDLKLGISEKSIFHEFHPDAEDLFNVTCDLKLVCEKLRDRSERHKRQDIEVGKAVRPQLALRVSNVGAAWKRLHGKAVVVECKFDGDRIQLHKNDSEIHFFSRNFLPHPEYEHAMTDIIANNILVDRCILDGEMLVWDTHENRFADFGSNQEIAKATREGLDSDRQLCYVAFDILYAGDTSVIHQSLSERHDLLSKVVKQIKGRFEILVPQATRHSEDSCRSFVARGVDEVEKFFKETVENRDEGIILKDLGSKWEPGDRSGKWLKLKPEYIRAGADLDVLIIGGYYGSGRHGGKVAQFLVGLAERPLPNMHPRRFISFCRVGTGLSDEELETVVNKLKPYFRKYEYPKKAAPSFYQVTNSSKERPDVWVESPEKSIVLSITSDIRTIKSEVFAAPYSLRFPRIDRARFDKPWYECLDVQTFVELVHSSNGTTHRGQVFDDIQDHKPKRSKSAKKVERNVSSVPSHFVSTDVSTVKSETLIFLKMVFYFANIPSTHSLDLLHKMVVENGGTFSMNLNNSVTHCIAAESRGIKFQAAKLHGDVIHYSWLLDCCLQKKLLPLQPKYFLYLSEPSKRKIQGEIDATYSYFVDVDAADLKQLLSNMNPTQDSKSIDHYKKKYCPKQKWAQFQDCYIYFKLSPPLINSELKVLLELALRRMKVAVLFGGGRVTCDLTHATHVVVLSSPLLAADFSKLLPYFPEDEKRLLLGRSIQVVASQWVEDCIYREQKVPEEYYSLKPSYVQNSVFEEDKDELYLDRSPSLDAEGLNTSSSGKVGSLRGQGSPDKPKLLTLPKLGKKTKRGQSSGTGANKGKDLKVQLRRVRSRIGNKPAKIYESDSDGSAPSDNLSPDKMEVQARNDESHEMSGKWYREKIPKNQPRIVRARIGKKPVKIHDSESGRNVSTDNLSSNEEAVVQPGNVETSEMADKRIPEIQDKFSSKDVEVSNTVKAVEQDPLEHQEVHEAPRINSVSKTGAEEHNTQEHNAADPVQAMLLQMIPCLGSNRLGSASHGPEAQKLPIEVANKEPALDTVLRPEKKRKVSYKDFADELLKD